MHVQRAHRKRVRPRLLKMDASESRPDAPIYAKNPLITHLALMNHTQT